MRSQDKKAVASNIEAQAKYASILFIWTDCDREGEHIGSEVAAVCRSANRGIVVKRARFSAVIAAYVFAFKVIDLSLTRVWGTDGWSNTRITLWQRWTCRSSEVTRSAVCPGRGQLT